MSNSRLVVSAALMAALFGAGYWLGATRAGAATPEPEAASAPAPQATRVFELRTYTTPDGKYDDLLARFRDHTLRIFEKHGMTNVGYWTPQDDPLRRNTLIYLLAHPSREAADRAWADFSADPEWQRVAEESQRDGRLVIDLERVFLDPTDFSPMR